MVILNPNTESLDVFYIQKSAGIWVAISKHGTTEPFDWGKAVTVTVIKERYIPKFELFRGEFEVREGLDEEAQWF